jgi:hypothetical protein
MHPLTVIVVKIRALKRGNPVWGYHSLLHQLEQKKHLQLFRFCEKFGGRIAWARRWIIWSTCHFINSQICQFAIWSLYYWACWLVILSVKFLFWKLGILSASLSFWMPTCDIVNLPFGHCAVSLTCHLINLSFDHLVILSTCHFINLPFYQPTILSTCHFINLPFFQLAMFYTCHLATMPFHQITIFQLAFLSTCHFINLLFCQLAILLTCCIAVSQITIF